jgi:2-phospho-L-lactate/phosphoenolpyruvate guanylyltransferase
VEAILIPVKRLEESKTRLASVLAPQDRRRLGLAMLADVLRAAEKWPNKLIITADPDAEAVGLAFGCNLIPDPGYTLNEAINAATQATSGVHALLILQSDVPLVTSFDIGQIFASKADVVVVPSSDGGTNALLRRPPNAISSRFGPNSAQAHIAEAKSHGLDVRSLPLDSLALDIDTPEDLKALAGSSTEKESTKLARELTLSG